MSTLVAGANTVLPDGPWTLCVTGPYDVCALVLGADGRVAGDVDFVFYNQPSTAGVRLVAGGVTVDAGRLRSGAARVVVLASPQDAGIPLGRLAVPGLTVTTPGGRGLVRFDATGLTTQTVVQLAELYRHGPGWKLRALGAGYDDGLAGLARDFGVDVAEEPEPGPEPASALGSAPEHSRLADVVSRTNVARAAHGLGPLTADRRLAAAAQAHNDDMVRRGFFAHESPDGATVADRVRAAGYAYGVVAENIAAGQRTADEVVQGWMDSPGHRANILNRDVREIGVGYTEGGGYGTSWTQVFGRAL